MYIITLSTIFYISYSDTNLYILQLEVGNILLVTYSRLQVLKEVLSLWRQYKKDLYLKPQSNFSVIYIIKKSQDICFVLFISLRGGKEVKKRKFCYLLQRAFERRGDSFSIHINMDEHCSVLIAFMTIWIQGNQYV